MDRAARFEERLAAVEARHRRRHRRRLLLLVGAVLTVAGLLGAVGVALAGPVGLAVAAGILAVSGLAWWLVRRMAAARGALAWDWQAGRYRLWGNPSARVQALDRSPDQRKAGDDREGPRDPRNRR